MGFLWLIPTILALSLAVLAIYLFQSRERLSRELADARAQAFAAQEKTAEHALLKDELKAAVAARYEAEKKVELAQQKMDGLELRMKDWETQREESVRTAKAAILEAGGQMSNKLLEDHKREQAASKQEQETRLKQTTESLLQQVTHITQSVSTLREQTVDMQKRTETVWRALSSPTAAGQLAEVGLENTLKNLGLEPGRDFIMQYGISDKETGNRLRPDALLFLPQDVVIVVDSKASKFVLGIAEAETEAHRAEAMERLKSTMHQHVKDLSSKDYETAVRGVFRDRGETGGIRTLLNVMYLPSEAALERMKHADGDFPAKAEKAGIILAGPASLHGLFSLAKMQIATARQAENYDRIVQNIENLMESTATVLGYADRIGMNIRKAAEEFNKMASSANRRLIPRMKQLTGMGVKPARNKALPAPIMTYDVRRLDDPFTLELEAEEEIGLPALEKNEA